MKKENCKCIICDSTKYSTVFSYDEPDKYEKIAGISNQEYYRSWVQCVDCGFYYSIYSRDQAMLDEVYVSKYRQEGAEWRANPIEETFHKVIALPDDSAIVRNYVRWIKDSIDNSWKWEILPKVNPPFDMLDIGGGTAVFAYEFQDEYWNSHVVDPDENGRFIESKLGIPYLQQVYEAGCFNKKFDLVSLLATLEHLEDPIEVLSEVHGDMKKEALLFIGVPDAIAFEQKPQDNDIFNSCHLWMFSPKSLTLLLYKCGYEVLSLLRMKTVREDYVLLVIAKEK